MNEKKDLRFVIYVDEIDATLDKASPAEDGHAILHLLSQLLTDPNLPIRLLLTVTDKEILTRFPGGTVLLEDLQTWKIPLCISVAEVRELIERFEVPVKFDDEALDRVFYYSGGQIYFVKLAVRLAVNAGGVQADEKERKKMINAQRVDKLMHEVISPLSSSSNVIRDTNDMVFRTMTNIYSMFFSKEEQQFMQVLAEAKGVLRISSLQVSETQFEKIANELYQRGYISKVRTDENEEYSWRIGIWQLFLEEYHQLRYRKR